MLAGARFVHKEQATDDVLRPTAGATGGTMHPCGAATQPTVQTSSAAGAPDRQLTPAHAGGQLTDVVGPTEPDDLVVLPHCHGSEGNEDLIDGDGVVDVADRDAPRDT